MGKTMALQWTPKNYSNTHFVLHGLGTVAADGTVLYSEVRSFLKKQPDIISKFKSIKISGNKTLTLTRNHLVYARKVHNDKFNPMWVILILLKKGTWFDICLF